uniref:Beta/gamma crystallin 'Greek key' domain-containing protein n=1 Tax=Callorhinchus milii TaxID=7868 RepID=A0A4W3GXI9_CALMI
MNKLVAYEYCDFKGLSREFTDHVDNLLQVSFGHAISSLEVLGQPWLAFSGLSGQGEFRLFVEGRYADLGSFRNRTLSLKIIMEDLSEPTITLFDAPNFMGTSQVYGQETDLSMGDMDNRAASHNVSRGVWCLFSLPGCAGSMLLAKAGELLHDYSNVNFSQSLSYLRPVRPVEPVVIGVHVLWGSGSVKKSKQSAGEICSENPSPIAQKLSVVQSITKEVSVTQAISFSAFSVLTVGTRFNLCSTLSDNLTTGFMVQKGRIEAKTSTFKRQVDLPTEVPAHSKVNVSIMLDITRYSFPVEIEVWRGSSTKIEIKSQFLQSPLLGLTTHPGITPINLLCAPLSPRLS